MTDKLCRSFVQNEVFVRSVTSEAFASRPFWLKCFKQARDTRETVVFVTKFQWEPRLGFRLRRKWTGSVREKDDRVRLGRRSEEEGDDLCASEGCSTPARDGC